MAEETVNTIDGEVIDAPVEEGPVIDFGGKAVLNAAEEQQIIRDRIKEHEAAIAKEELLVFEAQVLGKHDEAAQHQAIIANSYMLVSKYVNEFNRRYGGGEDA